MTEKTSDFIKLTGLYKSKDPNGQTYLSGSLAAITQMSVMPNKYKETEKDPDYLVYLRPAKKKSDDSKPQGNDEF